MTAEFRIEHDTMGEVKVPAKALYRAQTQRAVENFPISGKVLTSHHISALGQVKRAAAFANAELGVIDEDKAKAIAAAAEQVIAGDHDGEFPIDVFQTGSGTSSNMNTNEVISTIATRDSGIEIHPNDHVNASQSSNDVFPSSIHIAATKALSALLFPSSRSSQSRWRRRPKSSRTSSRPAAPTSWMQPRSCLARSSRATPSRSATALSALRPQSRTSLNFPSAEPLSARASTPPQASLRESLSSLPRTPDFH